MEACDMPGCGESVVLLAYAAYDVASADVHPRVARYPQPMVRACDLHLSTLLAWDSIAPGSTRQWLVTGIPWASG